MGARPAREPLPGPHGRLEPPERRVAEEADGEGEERVSFQELARPFRVFRSGIRPGPEALVLRLGPVLGKVTDTTAVILLEVGPPGGDISLNVARALPARHLESNPSEVVWASEPPFHAWQLESVEFATGGSVSVCQIMEPGRPYSFALEGLEPDTVYFAFIGGVREDDLRHRVARFRTLPQRVDTLRLLALSGHQPAEQDLGPQDPWSRLHEKACRGPEVQLVLHLGSTVDVDPAAEEAAREMKEHGAFRLGLRRELERRARDAMRGAFAAAWGGHEGLRRTLAEVGSHLPAFSPVVDLKPYLQRSAQAESLEERRALLRLALDVSREYQRALWQPGRSAGACVVRADAGGGGSASAGAFHYREFWQEAGPVSDMAAEEWHFHRYGLIGILVLDTKGSLLNSSGLAGKAGEAAGAGQRPLLSLRQRDALGRALKDRMMQVLIVASDTPFLLEPAAAAPRDTAVGSSAEFVEASPLEWRSHAAELHALLEALFEWKHAQFPDREVVLLSASPGFGTTGDVCDHQLGLSITTVLAGPVLGPISPPGRWALKGTLAGGRFSWSYRPPLEQCNFCSVDVDLSASASGLGKLFIDVELVGVPAPTDASWPGGPLLALE